MKEKAQQDFRHCWKSFDIAESNINTATTWKDMNINCTNKGYTDYYQCIMQL